MSNRIVVRMGLTCNNRCSFCIFGSEKEKLRDRTEEEIKKILKSNTRYNGVVFTGGEPCLRPDLLSLVKYAKSLGFKEIQIQSNGRMFFYRDLCRKLIEAGATEFALALHGHNARIHDSLTGIRGSFAQTLLGIKNLKSLGQYVITNTVISKSNYKYIPQMADLLVKLGIEHFQFSFVHIIGNAWENRDWLVASKSEILPYLFKGLDIGLNAGKRVTTEAIPYCLLQGYEDCVVESFIPQSRVFELDSIIKDLKYHRIFEKKAKNKKCCQCKYYDRCEGPWKEYPKLFGWKEFRPVEGKSYAKLAAVSDFMGKIGYKNHKDWYFWETSLVFFLRGYTSEFKETDIHVCVSKDKLPWKTDIQVGYSMFPPDSSYWRAYRDFSKRHKLNLHIIVPDFDYSGKDFITVNLADNKKARVLKEINFDKTSLARGSFETDAKSLKMRRERLNEIKSKALKKKDKDTLNYCEEALKELANLKNAAPASRDDKKFCGRPIEVAGYEIIKGNVQKVFTDQDCESFRAGNILMSHKTSVDLLPAIVKASAIVTEQGGVFCHAACVCRELKIPGVVGVAGITDHVRDGDLVEIDIKKGTVAILSAQQL